MTREYERLFPKREENGNKSLENRKTWDQKTLDIYIDSVTEGFTPSQLQHFAWKVDIKSEDEQRQSETSPDQKFGT